MLENPVSTSNKGVFFSIHFTVFLDENQTVYIGVTNKTDVVVFFFHHAANLIQIFAQRFGIVSKLSVGLTIQYVISHAQLVEKFR